MILALIQALLWFEASHRELETTWTAKIGWNFALSDFPLLCHKYCLDFVRTFLVVLDFLNQTKASLRSRVVLDDQRLYHRCFVSKNPFCRLMDEQSKVDGIDKGKVVVTCV
jgi:hypothetical protein